VESVSRRILFIIYSSQREAAPPEHGGKTAEIGR
jgi:hypothetical protein